MDIKLVLLIVLAVVLVIGAGTYVTWRVLGSAASPAKQTSLSATDKELLTKPSELVSLPSQ
jgi:flagellar basal body-associated protein FliL